MARSVCYLCEKEQAEAIGWAKLELESKLNEEVFEVANQALLQGDRVLNKLKKESSAQAKGWYTQKGCICKTEPKNVSVVAKQLLLV